jgi:cation transport ATPase
VRNFERDYKRERERERERVFCCTGDDAGLVSEVAREVGIDLEKLCAGFLPEEKGELMDRLRR